MRKLINSWFNIPEGTQWNYPVLEELLNYVTWPEENWKVLGEFYQAPAPTTSREEDRDNPLHYRRKSPDTLVTNLPGELAKAIRWAETRSSSMRKLPRQEPHSSPPCDDWKQLAVSSALVQPEALDNGLDWASWPAEIRASIWAVFEQEQKKNEKSPAD